MPTTERYFLCFRPNDALAETMCRGHSPRIRRQLIGSQTLLVTRDVVEVSDDCDDVLDLRRVRRSLRGEYTNDPGAWFQSGLTRPTHELPIADVGTENGKLTLDVNLTNNSYLTATPAMRAIGLGKLTTKTPDGRTMLSLLSSVAIPDNSPNLERMRRTVVKYRYDPELLPLAVVFHSFVSIS